MNNIDFNKYDDIALIKDYDGFIDSRGYFYRVCSRKDKSKSKIDHNLWAEVYIKKNIDKFKKINFINSGLFTFSKVSSPSDLLVNIYGFVYYSHDIDYHKPIIKIPNPKYNGCKMTREQDELLYTIMMLNNEQPENNPIFLEDNVYNYVGMEESSKRRK